MYDHHRRRSRSPMPVLPQHHLRFVASENRIAALEEAMAKVREDVRGWKDWESYLFQVYFWARDVAAAFAKFPWAWRQPRAVDAGTSSTSMEEP